MTLESENKILKDKLSRIFAILAEEYLVENISDDGIILTLEDFIEMHRANIAGV